MQKITNCFYVLLAAFFTSFLFGSLFFRAMYNVDEDLPYFVKQNVLVYFVSIVIGLILFIAANCFLEKANKISTKKVIIIMLSLSVILQVTIVVLFPTIPTSDQNIVHVLAKRISMGDFSSLQKGEYLYIYPNNLAYTFLLATFYSILPKVILIPKIVNIFLQP